MTSDQRLFGSCSFLKCWVCSPRFNDSNGEGVSALDHSSTIVSYGYDSWNNTSWDETASALMISICFFFFSFLNKHYHPLKMICSNLSGFHTVATRLSAGESSQLSAWLGSAMVRCWRYARCFRASVRQSTQRAVAKWTNLETGQKFKDRKKNNSIGKMKQIKQIK